MSNHLPKTAVASAAVLTALNTSAQDLPDFKAALADSWRVRGQMVEGYPSTKLSPTAQTTVAAIQKK